MTKKSVLARNRRRIELVGLYAEKRSFLKKKLMSKASEMTMKERIIETTLLSSLPRDTSAVRIRVRCGVTGRPRGCYRYFMLSRIMLRLYASYGYLPGVLKKSL